MKNLYWASTHPAFCLHGGFECECGKWSATKEHHNNHVMKDHDEHVWKRMLSAKDYQKLIIPLALAESQP